MMDQAAEPPRPMRRGRRDRQSASANIVATPITRGVDGGRYLPLSADQLKKVDEAARDILISIGLSEAPGVVVNTITARGGRLDDDGRLHFTAALIEEALAGFQRNFVLHGRGEGLDLQLSGHNVHMGTGGAAPSIVDIETGLYRNSTLADLHNAARIVDKLDHIHFFSRPLVSRDMEGDLQLDLNTAFASVSGTRKHIFTSAAGVASVDAIAALCFAIAGSQEAFVRNPFLSLNINHVVPPLRFSAEACEVMARAARLGIPFHANTFGQLGASTPVTVAGTLAQTTAETLAGMIFGWCINPEAKITFGSRPMITDLRTGAMSGGSGEQARLMAAAVQISKYYGLADTCIAGATDSKIADAQSGYEKALTVSLAAQAGSNAITQAAGMHAALVGCALESYVIDNDMLGAIMRSLGSVDFEGDALSIEAIRNAVTGDGHYLGQADTLKRMNSDFLYPRSADRSSFDIWQKQGSKDIRSRAIVATRELLEQAPRSVLDPALEMRLREDFDIRLA